MIARSLGLALVTGALLAAACAEDLAPPVACRDIPEGGCPRRGDACADPSCAALYVCQADGTWRFERDCPPREPPPPDAAPPDALAPQPDAGEYADVPGAFGGPGCASLVAPDCALGTAASCSGCCGCEDVFVCVDQGWTLWGRCEDGALREDGR